MLNLAHSVAPANTRHLLVALLSQTALHAWRAHIGLGLAHRLQPHVTLVQQEDIREVRQKARQVTVWHATAVPTQRPQERQLQLLALCVPEEGFNQFWLGRRQATAFHALQARTLPYLQAQHLLIHASHVQLVHTRQALQ